MNPEIHNYNLAQTSPFKEICEKLSKLIEDNLPLAENKVWHAHPVWFIDKNPICGYSKLKAGIRFMFWSGADFDEEKLHQGSGKFKDASVLYTSPDEIIPDDVKRWLEKAHNIQWDYKNVVKRKGKLERLK